MSRVAAATLILFAMVFVGIADAQQTRLYRWVDEDGKVHFSDRLEPSSGTSDYDRFNASGVRISQPERPRTRQQQREAEEARRNYHRDQALLTAYPTELALLRAHDEQRAQVEFSLRTSQANLERIQRDIASRGDPGPDASGDSDVDRELAELNRRLEAERKTLEQLRLRRYELYQTQNQEVERFRELNQAASGDSSPNGVDSHQIPD